MPFKSIFVTSEEMQELWNKIKELLSDKKNVALGSDRDCLRRILDKPLTPECLEGRCTIYERDFINGLFADHKRWEKERAKKEK